MHFSAPHNEIKCVLSIKESYSGKMANIFTNAYGQAVNPPYGQLIFYGFPYTS